MACRTAVGFASWRLFGAVSFWMSSPLFEPLLEGGNVELNLRDASPAVILRSPLTSNSKFSRFHFLVPNSPGKDVLRLIPFFSPMSFDLSHGNDFSVKGSHFTSNFSAAAVAARESTVVVDRVCINWHDGGLTPSIVILCIGRATRRSGLQL